MKLNIIIYNLDKCNKSCNVVDNLSTKICVPNKTKSLNVKVFNMITRIKESNALIRHISCDCKCKVDSTTCKSNQKWYNETRQCKCINYSKCKKYYNWNLSTCNYKNGKYLKSIADQ